MKNKFFGERLRSARNFHGMSLQDLGEKISTSRQYIQQLENSEKKPSEEMLAVLAEALKVNPDFFYTDHEFRIIEEQCHFRSLKTTSATLRRQAIEHGNFLNLLVENLVEELDFPDINFPKLNFDINSKNDIEKAAELCRSYWGLGLNSPIMNMVRVLENAGAIVTYFNDVSEKIDAFSVHTQRPLIIRNPSKESVCRMRFDLAHECGHIVMHAGIETGDSKTESEANRFASALLLPRTAFLNEFSFLAQNKRISWQRIYDLKVKWKVSISAIIRRAYDLELIDAIKYRNANIYLRRTGQTKFEKYDDEIPMEAAEVLPSAINVLKEDDGELLNLIRSMQIHPLFLQKIIGGLKINEEDFISYKNTNVVKLWSDM